MTRNPDMTRNPGWRSYEVYQRMRVGESTARIKPRQLSSDDYLTDPYPLLAILREEYPCYRDWPGNCFWITRYDDVTSVFVDDANYETRPRLWSYARVGFGNDLGASIPVQQAFADAYDRDAAPVADSLIAELAPGSDLATELCARYPLELLVRALDLPAEGVGPFIERYLVVHRGTGFEPTARARGIEAMDALVVQFEPLMGRGGADVLSTIHSLGGSARDAVVTLLEGDHQTLHGGLANMWCLLLTHSSQLAVVCDQPRLLRFAWLETLRHSTPVVSADRFAKHEVERFSRLLPEGALLRCSSAAANRDQSVFDEPDAFVVERKDLCQREPRGMYRADGLPSGISFGTGAPSTHPAVPEDRPRSRYAITRDLAITASRALLDAHPMIHLADGAAPALRSLRWGEMHTCWSLPVVW